MMDRVGDVARCIGTADHNFGPGVSVRNGALCADDRQQGIDCWHPTPGECAVLRRGR
ncbi:MAG: hypothetical protein JWO15_1781 [Sphingomonadales bacterium]|nr:hypothetical protein [Sphingomonadales bacterium]